jgi:hypothetical protein
VESERAGPLGWTRALPFRDGVARRLPPAVPTHVRARVIERRQSLSVARASATARAVARAKALTSPPAGRRHPRDSPHHAWSFE